MQTLKNSLGDKLRNFLLGPSITMDLPDHVQAAIKQQQNTGEKLISWVLLVIVIIFGTLYFVSPKTFSSTAKFAPVPWALSAYFIFSFIRLTLSYRNYLPNWFLMMSILVDISLLMTLIWSFHLQYQQPAAFYLKAPTLLYMFIFIALRTLRFEAKYVLTVGIISAIGWLSLLLYALATSPADTITRNYVLYMTSNHILIGGEIDKIISILMVTFILTIAVLRGQRLLTQAIAETIATDELSKFFIPEIATNIIQSGQEIKPGYGESGDVAILHCDIRGFTEMAKHSTPTEVMCLLTEYQSKVVNVIRDYQGSVDKFLGDGILVSFNAVKKSSNYAADALNAAVAINRMIKQWSEERIKDRLKPIHVGVSITIGSVILGIVGDEKRMEYTVIGDPVNLAAKLDKHCKIEHCSVLATEEALNLAVSQGFVPLADIEILRQRKVEGISDPLNLAVLVKL